MLGQTEDGALWTLEECRWSTPSSGTSAGTELISERTTPTFAYRGAHLVDERARQVTAIGCSFTGLPAWLRAKSFTIDTRTRHDGEIEYGIAYRRPSDISATGRDVHIVIQHRPNLPSIGRTSIFVSEYIGFSLSASLPIAIAEWIERFLSPLQNLMTFATGVPNAFMAPSAVLAAREGSNPVEVSLYFRHLHGLQRVSRNFAKQRLFDFPDVKDRWSDLCPRWLSLYEDEDMTRVLDLYFSTQYRRTTSETEFQNLVEAAEAYHRCRFAGDSKRVLEHRERREQVLKQIRDGDREWASAHLRARTEPNLKTRLLQLVMRETAAMQYVVRDAGPFVDFVDARRHELSHRGPPRSGEGAVIELAYTTERLKFLLQACLLRELGFNDREIVELLWNNSRFAYLANQT
jgi:hypothetical protein